MKLKKACAHWLVKNRLLVTLVVAGIIIVRGVVLPAISFI